MGPVYSRFVGNFKDGPVYSRDYILVPPCTCELIFEIEKSQETIFSRICPFLRTSLKASFSELRKAF